MTAGDFKFCKNCTHCAPDLAHKEVGDQLQYAKCTRVYPEWHNTADHVNLISGQPKLLYCSSCRDSPILCGVEARFFEPAKVIEVTHEHAQQSI